VLDLYYFKQKEIEESPEEEGKKEEGVEKD
jgi:hypothetical protein